METLRMNADLFIMVALALLLLKPALNEGKVKFSGWYLKVSALVAVILLIAPVVALLKWAGGLVGIGGH